jgi:hypothetical protein
VTAVSRERENGPQVQVKNGGGLFSGGVPLDGIRGELALSLEDLWIAYIGLGGMLGLPEMTAYLAGTGEVSRLEHVVLAHALEERFMDDEPLAVAVVLPTAEAAGAAAWLSPSIPPRP